MSITGGKLTTYRKMAADTVDAVQRELGAASAALPNKAPCAFAARRASAPSGLATSPSGWASRPRCWTGSRGVTAREASAVLGLTVDRPELREPLVPGLPHLSAEVVYAARYEMATCVEDVLSRRTRALLLDARSAAAAAGRDRRAAR